MNRIDAKYYLMEACKTMNFDTTPLGKTVSSNWQLNKNGNKQTLYQDRLERFFESIKSPTSTPDKPRYKRLRSSPLRYAGGKSLAAGFIAEHLPQKAITHIVSPFFGGGSFEFGISNALDLEIIGGDVFDLLVNYWQHQLTDSTGLANVLRDFNPTPEYYRIIKEKLKAHWNGNVLIKDKQLLAAIYYFNHNCSYGPHFLGHPSSVYLQKDRYIKLLERVESFSAPKVSVVKTSFESLIINNKRSFLYCDPPYFLSGNMFVGMYPHRNFPIHHVGFNHELLRDLLIKHKGGWILSYNDCPEIREFYKGFKMCEPQWQYTFGQGDTRIGENRLNGNGTHIKKSHELLIWKD